MEFHGVSKNCMKEWYILRSIGFLITCGMFVACFFIPTDEAGAIIAKTCALIVTGMLALWAAIYAFVFPKMQYNRLKYRLDALRIEKKSGVIFLREEFVPFVRIQHAEIYRGIFDRIFDMATVVIYTAGSHVRIQNLDTAEAEILASKIKSLLENEARGDVND